MAIELSPEQMEDAVRMASTPDLPNFSKPGTGKTHTALEAISLFGSSSNLILAPKIALHWWHEQARDYLGADARILKTGNSPLAGDIMITTYDIARNMKEKLYEHFRSGTLTLDESHYVASVEAKRTQALFGRDVDLRGSLAERFDTVWCMTGTPQQNHANDYYTQAAILHPDEFAHWDINTYEAFCRRFTFKQLRQYNPRMRPVMKIVGSANEGLLHKIVYETIGAIHRLEAPNLPGLRYRELDVSIKIDKDTRMLLKGLEHLSASEILDALNVPGSAIAKAWHAIGMAKVAEIVPYVGDSYKSSPVLLGCWHRDVMQAYDDAFTKMGLRVQQVHGGTSEGMRRETEKAFNGGFIDVLIGQMRAMGVSWNLQEACSHVVIAEVYPSPSMLEQFYKRVYRRGQVNACTVDLVLADSMDVDHALNAVRGRKEASADKVENG